ncbi:DgyrCDS12245 [Dimorphilus gyrociliatus]|uniref:DgyrCDS12245 n=1 Tax=Dimorphilus gyrociliatus TaxID=2664684 RepID=A0A7I8W5W9_9ANNE|nr:DgyrCDS12245 [Dimorphilus gyrociliatus]
MDDCWSEFKASPMNMTDPWASQSEKNAPKAFIMPNFRKDLTSEEYIASLEHKLKKLQDKRKKPSAKDMIESLAGKKEMCMKETIESNNYDEEQEESFSDNFGDGKIASLQRRINPQRPVSGEEVKSLVHHDILDIQKAKLEEEESNSLNMFTEALSSLASKQELNIPKESKENTESPVTPLECTEPQ